MTRHLSTDDLNRTVLARQLLLERARLPLHRAVQRMAGVQAQYAPSAYIGLWSRVQGFTRGQLDAALRRRSIIQATLMRGTIHMVAKADFWPLAEATRPGRQRGWLQTFGGQYDVDLVRSRAEALESLLSTGPRKRRELLDELDVDPDMWNGMVNWVDLVRVPPSGTWESRRADLYGLATEWVGSGVVEAATGRDLLIRRYLGGFGPASRGDIQRFTLLPMDLIDESLVRLPNRVFRTDDEIDLFDLRGGRIVNGDTPVPIRFIGNWDAVLLAHARRADVLPEAHRSRIFHTRVPHSFATVLVDGRVRGTWGEEGGSVHIDWFEPLPSRFRAAVDEEKDRLQGFLAPQ